MKPHKYEKLHSYDPSKPWATPKKPKPKKLKHLSKKEMQFFQYCPLPAVPTVVKLYVASAVKFGPPMPEDTLDIEYINGEKFSIHRRYTGQYGGFYAGWAEFTLIHSSIKGRKERIAAFVEQPLPIAEPSLLILPKEFIEKRRLEKQSEAMANFLENEITNAILPMLSEIDQLRDIVRAKTNEENKLALQNFQLKKDMIMLLDEMAQLRKYKTRVDVATAHIGERSRYFREDESCQ